MQILINDGWAFVKLSSGSTIDDAEKAVAVLQSGSFIASKTDVLAFAVPNTPGGLYRLLAKFNEASVNIEYMYAFLGNEDKTNAYMICT